MITRLYCNREEFEDIEFHGGLNVVLGEIRLKRDMDRDTHNLGKSTVCEVLDFCLLKRVGKKDSFLLKHDELFHDYIFFLELRLADGRYLTIRRDVATASKIWLYVTEDRGVDARDLDDEDWTHRQLPFKRAKTLVDGLLGYGSLQPWDYRRILAYLFRGQLGFGDVFKPWTIGRNDRDWKPFLLHIMGFDYQVFDRRYDLEGEIEDLKAQESRLASQLSDGPDDSGELDALLAIKQREVEDLQAFLDDFRLEPHDQIAVTELVEDVDARIGELNDRRYDLRYTIAQIERSLEKEKLLFSTVEAKALFEEAGILFQGQIEHSFNQLLAFNADITEERRTYLKEDLKETRESLRQVEEELVQLDNRRGRLLVQIGSRDIVTKYKAATDDLVQRRTELESIKNRRAQVRELQRLRREIASRQAELAACDATIQDEIDAVSDVEGAGLFARLRAEFDDIVYRVISQHGMLSVSVNNMGHAEFRADISDKRGMTTNQDEGVTYKKLLCVAFDLALLLVHDASSFPDFVFHDDVFGALDNRKKQNLRDVMRSCGNRGVQQVVTAIDSELPTSDFFDSDEIILRLHDDGDDGRLFKMPEW